MTAEYLILVRDVIYCFLELPQEVLCHIANDIVPFPLNRRLPFHKRLYWSLRVAPKEEQIEVELQLLVYLRITEPQHTYCTRSPRMRQKLRTKSSYFITSDENGPGLNCDLQQKPNDFYCSVVYFNRHVFDHNPLKHMVYTVMQHDNIKHITWSGHIRRTVVPLHTNKPALNVAFCYQN